MLLLISILLLNLWQIYNCGYNENNNRSTSSGILLV